MPLKYIDYVKRTRFFSSCSIDALPIGKQSLIVIHISRFIFSNLGGFYNLSCFIDFRLEDLLHAHTDTDKHGCPLLLICVRSVSTDTLYSVSLTRCAASKKETCMES